MKNLVAELFITPKKELRIADSRLVETLSKLNNHIWYSGDFDERDFLELLDEL